MHALNVTAVSAADTQAQTSLGLTPRAWKALCGKKNECEVR